MRWLSAVAIALVLGWAVAPPASATNEEIPWWAQDDAGPEVDHDWWANPDDVVSLDHDDPLPSEAAPQDTLAAAVAPPDAEIPTGEDDTVALGMAAVDEGFEGGPAGSAMDVAPSAEDAVADPEGAEEAELGEGTGSDPSAGSARDRDDDVGNRCRRYANQIAKFENDLSLARDRDNEVWEQVVVDHLARLKAQKERHCPEPEGPSVMEVAKKVVKKAAKLALMAARMGAFGGF